jgi:hypothetical protein
MHGNTTASHAAQVSSCLECGDAFAPHIPWQRFCSHRCRQAALRRRKANGAGVTHSMRQGSGALEIIAVRSNVFGKTQQNQCTRDASNEGGRSPPPDIIEAEVFAGRQWRPVFSSDGVFCEVAALRRRAFRDGGAS